MQSRSWRPHHHITSNETSSVLILPDQNIWHSSFFFWKNFPWLPWHDTLHLSFHPLETLSQQPWQPHPAALSWPDGVPPSCVQGPVFPHNHSLRQSISLSSFRYHLNADDLGMSVFHPESLLWTSQPYIQLAIQNLHLEACMPHGCYYVQRQDQALNFSTPQPSPLLVLFMWMTLESINCIGQKTRIHICYFNFLQLWYPIHHQVLLSLSHKQPWYPSKHLHLHCQ